jgi:hypothetical protein
MTKAKFLPQRRNGATKIEPFSLRLPLRRCAAAGGNSFK